MKSRGTAAKRRPYDNRLRQEQAHLTRQRILDAVTKLVSAGELEGLSVAQIAERAGVSEPTIYRHFGSREQLYSELDEHIRDQIGLPVMETELDGLPHVAAKLFRQFQVNAPLLRAALRSGIARDIRAQAKPKRHQKVREALARYTPHLPAPEADALAGVYRVLVSWEAWDRLTGELGVEPELAGEAVAWALTALNARLQEDRAANRTTIRITRGEEDGRTSRGRS
ncbi:MAG: TetR/AcrR family transcriptional regulator [Myxococcales bacterium]